MEVYGFRVGNDVACVSLGDEVKVFTMYSVVAGHPVREANRNELEQALYRAKPLDQLGHVSTTMHQAIAGAIAVTLQKASR